MLLYPERHLLSVDKMQRSFLPAILLLAFSAAATITANESPGKAAIGNTVNPVESTLQMVIKAINELVE